VSTKFIGSFKPHRWFIMFMLRVVCDVQFAAVLQALWMITTSLIQEFARKGYVLEAKGVRALEDTLVEALIIADPEHHTDVRFAWSILGDDDTLPSVTHLPELVCTAIPLRLEVQLQPPTSSAPNAVGRTLARLRGLARVLRAVIGVQFERQHFLRLVTGHVQEATHDGQVPTVVAQISISPEAAARSTLESDLVDNYRTSASLLTTGGRWTAPFTDRLPADSLRVYIVIREAAGHGEREAAMQLAPQLTSRAMATVTLLHQALGAFGGIRPAIDSDHRWAIWHLALLLVSAPVERVDQNRSTIKAWSAAADSLFRDEEPFKLQANLLLPSPPSERAWYALLLCAELIGAPDLAKAWPFSVSQSWERRTSVISWQQDLHLGGGVRLTVTPPSSCYVSNRSTQLYGALLLPSKAYKTGELGLSAQVHVRDPLELCSYAQKEGVVMAMDGCGHATLLRVIADPLKPSRRIFGPCLLYGWSPSKDAWSRFCHVILSASDVIGCGTMKAKLPPPRALLLLEPASMISVASLDMVERTASCLDGRSGFHILPPSIATALKAGAYAVIKRTKVPDLHGLEIAAGEPEDDEEGVASVKEPATSQTMESEDHELHEASSGTLEAMLRAANVTVGPHNQHLAEKTYSLLLRESTDMQVRHGAGFLGQAYACGRLVGLELSAILRQQVHPHSLHVDILLHVEVASSYHHPLIERRLASLALDSVQPQTDGDSGAFVVATLERLSRRPRELWQRVGLLPMSRDECAKLTEPQEAGGSRPMPLIMSSETASGKTAMGEYRFGSAAVRDLLALREGCMEREWALSAQHSAYTKQHAYMTRVIMEEQLQHLCLAGLPSLNSLWARLIAVELVGRFSATGQAGSMIEVCCFARECHLSSVSVALGSAEILEQSEESDDDGGGGPEAAAHRYQCDSAETTVSTSLTRQTSFSLIFWETVKTHMQQLQAGRDEVRSIAMSLCHISGLFR
jgi:hypothetical protein